MKEMTEHEREQERNWIYGLVMVVLGVLFLIFIPLLWSYRDDWSADAIWMGAAFESFWCTIASSGAWLMFPGKKWATVLWVLGWLPFFIWAMAVIFLCLALRLCS